MSVEKQIPSLCKLYSFYKELPEEFLDETDEDSYFYNHIFDISQSQHRIVRVSRGSKKQSFASNLIQCCDLKTQQRYILQEEVNISKRELTCLVDNLRDFLKIFDQASKCIQIPLPKPKVGIGSTKSKNNLLVRHYNDNIEHPNRQIRLSFPFGNNNCCLFSLKNFELHGNELIPTEIVNLNNREIHRLRRIQKPLLRCKQVWKNWEQLKCVAHSLLIVGMTIALLFSFDTCIVQIQSVQVDFACTKRLFSLSAEAIINARNARLYVRCAIFLLKTKKLLFLVAWPRGLHFWREPKISSRSYWRCLLSWQVLFQQREMRFPWWFCKNSEIHLCLWKVRSLVVCSQSSLYVTRARKNDKNRQNTFFLC